MLTLLTKIMAIFAPPSFDDETKNPPAIVLNAVLLISMGGLFCASIFSAFAEPDPLISGVIYGAVVVSLIPFYILMHQGYIRFVSWALVIVLWAVVTAVNVLLGGIEGPAVSAYLVIIVIGALLLGSWSGVLVAVINVVTMAALYFSRPEDVVQTSDTTTTFIIQAMMALLIAVFIYIASRTINRFLQKSTASAEALRHSIDELRRTTVSKNYVDNIIQSMSNLLFVINPDGTIRTVNSMTLDVLGYTESQLIGKRYNDIVLTGADAMDDETSGGLSATKLMQSSAYRNVDQVYRARDGREIPVTVSSAVMYDSEKRIQGVVCVAQDVTERRDAERKMQYQAKLLASVSDAIIATEMDLRITSWNAAAEDMYGFRTEEVIGRVLTDVVPTIFDSDTSGKIIKERYVERGYWQNEVEQKRRDGRSLYVLSSISILRDEKRKPSGIVTINHDITQRKEAELALRKRADQLSLLRRVDVGLSSTLDMTEVLKTALVAASDIAGADAGFIAFSDDNGDHLRVAHAIQRHENLPAGAMAAHGVLKRALDKHQAQFVPNVHTDADYIPDLPDTVAMMAFPLISQEKLLGVLNLETTGYDQFTKETFDLLSILASRIAAAVDNARLYAVLQQQLTELQGLYTQVSTLEALKTDMLRLASHDLRSPVGIINGYVQLLRVDLEGIANAEQMDFLDQIALAARRMDEISSNILSLERVHQLAGEAYDNEINLTDLIERGVRDHRGLADEEAITLTLAHEAERPITVRGDEGLLYEAIVNYITNALKYTPAGGAVTVAVHSGDDGRVSVEVTDTGYGIPKDQQERLFKPFSRARSEATAHIDGVGLGLHLVKNIIHRHNGEIIFRSEYGVGSTFGFCLPLKD